MKFSILIANYNNGQFLNEAVKSVINQTFNDWEIVIVDDASTDDSGLIYQKYKDDERIRIFRNVQNRGCGYTKRRCASLAKGEFCGFLDPDDALTSSAIEIMVKNHQELPNHSIIYSTHYVCDEKLRPLHIPDHVGQIPEGESQLTWMGPRIAHFATFKKELYQKTQGISEFCAKAVDQDLYYKLEETGPVHFVDKPLYFYRHHAGSISLNENKYRAYINRLEISYQAYKRRVTGVSYPVNNLQKYEVARRMLKYHNFNAYQYAKEKQYREMYRHLFFGLKFIYADSNLSIFRTAVMPVKQFIFNR